MEVNQEKEDMRRLLSLIRGHDVGYRLSTTDNGDYYELCVYEYDNNDYEHVNSDFKFIQDMMEKYWG